MTFEAIYDEHFRFVWRALRRLGVREGDVADAVQDVFLVVHRKLAEFQHRSKVSTWLYGICFRVARDRRRIAADRRTDAQQAEPDELADNRPDVLAELEHRREIEVLEAVLDEIPLDQRAVFTLFELDAMSGEEIAAMLEIPLGTVHSRLRLGRQAFREALARMQARWRFKATASGGQR
jgi:RNA polymerase sigma-70 factor (ECF subfamily)